MKLILKIFAMLFFVIFLSGCTDNQTKNYNYPSSSASNYNSYENNGYVKSSSMYDNDSIQTENNTETQQKTCCKYCSKGKACGDSCISRSYTCHKGPGCACDL